MKKVELICAAAQRAQMKDEEMAKALNALQAVITEKLVEGETVHLMGFGSFEVRERASRQAVNPRTREKIYVEATRVPAFKVGKTLRDRVAGRE